MHKNLSIPEATSDPTINICLDTIKKSKQALVFVNTKRGAESQAEKIAKKTSLKDTLCNQLAEEALKTFSRPTKQCQRLALCLKGGTAFHHAGLPMKQRELVEEGFRKGNIKVICATPTLAYGMNLPAFRTIIRDLQRYSGRGMEPIPVLEYQQMIGRSGRPDFHDDYGEAITLASSESEKQEIYEMYVTGEPEAILSKLAAEPALRTYTLALIAAHNLHSKKDLYAFFEKTLFAHQYQDLAQLNQIVDKVLKQLEEWEFIEMKTSDFQSADEYSNEPLKPTLTGRRVAELYLDPYTAHYLLECLEKALSCETKDVQNSRSGVWTPEHSAQTISYVHMLTRCLELRPLLTVKMSEIQNIQEAYLPFSEYLLEETPSEFDYEYEDYLKSVKTTLFLNDWLEEKDEEYLLEQYGVRPGELHGKLDICDWLLYSSGELAKLKAYTAVLNALSKLRVRLKYGAKEELLALLQLKDIGRVRARKLYQNGIKTLGDVRAVDLTKLGQLLGPVVAKNIKEQVGQEVKEVPKGKRKGQTSIEKYGKKEE